MINTIAEAFQSGVANLVGKDCWGAVAGEGTYSRFVLDFGVRFRRDRPVPNEFLSKEERENEAEFTLFVKSTPWRVQSANAVIASWLDDDANDGPLVAALDRFVGATVIEAHLIPPAWDLTLTFDNCLTLIVFADGTPRRDADDYSLGTRRIRFIVGMGGRLRTERRLLDVDIYDD
jgi:hypothetical protein